MICTPRVMISETGVMYISLATTMPWVVKRDGRQLADRRRISGMFHMTD
jgi:hypothetical protein